MLPPQISICNIWTMDWVIIVHDTYWEMANNVLKNKARCQRRTTHTTTWSYQPQCVTANLYNMKKFNSIFTFADHQWAAPREQGKYYHLKDIDWKLEVQLLIKVCVLCVWHFNPFTPVVPTGTTIFWIFYNLKSYFKKHICFPNFCYWITTNQIDHLVKRGSIKGLIFFAMSWRKSEKRRLTFGPPGMNGLSLRCHSS